MLLLKSRHRTVAAHKGYEIFETYVVGGCVVVVVVVMLVVVVGLLGVVVLWQV